MAGKSSASLHWRNLPSVRSFPPLSLSSHVPVSDFDLLTSF